MAIKALDGGRYKVDVRPRGRSGRRIQRIFKKKADAVAFERYVLSHMHDKEWLEKPTEQRHLSDLLPLWWELGGRNKPYANGVLTRLKKIIKEMNDPRVSQINARFMAAYRSSRLSLGVKESTVRRVGSRRNVYTPGKCRGISRRKSAPRPPLFETKITRNDVSHHGRNRQITGCSKR